jgi:hypothetical protein
VNETGEVFLSHTRLHGRISLRLSIGNLRTEPRHLERSWALLEEHAARLEGEAVGTHAPRRRAYASLTSRDSSFTSRRALPSHP